MNSNPNGDFEPNNDADEFFGADIENYNLPERKEVVLDVAGQKVIDTKDLSPIEMIEMTAKETGIRIKPFSKKNGVVDTGCRKSGCYGRGYTSFTDNVPNPCTCLFYKEDRDKNKNALNRKIVRSFQKISKKESQIIIKDKAKNYGLVKMYKKTDNSTFQIKLLGETASGVVFEWTNSKGKWDWRRQDQLVKTSLEEV